MSPHRASLRFLCSLALLLGALLCGLAAPGQRALASSGLGTDPASMAVVAVGDDAGQPPDDGSQASGQGSLEDNSVDDTLFLPATPAFHLAGFGSARPRGRQAAMISGPRLLETRPPIA
jgi:hypothetical protein